MSTNIGTIDAAFITSNRTTYLSTNITTFTQTYCTAINATN